MKSEVYNIYLKLKKKTMMVNHNTDSVCVRSHCVKRTNICSITRSVVETSMQLLIALNNSSIARSVRHTHFVCTHQTEAVITKMCTAQYHSFAHFLNSNSFHPFCKQIFISRESTTNQVMYIKIAQHFTLSQFATMKYLDSDSAI